MSDREVILVHYSEIALKGGNRAFFERELVRNIRRVVPRELVSSVRRISGRVVVELTDSSKNELVSKALMKVFGISWFAFARETEAKYDAIERAVHFELSGALSPSDSFRINAVRAHKGFPMTSMELNAKLGDAVVKAFGAKVNLEEPSIEVGVEVMRDVVFVYREKRRGLGGLPVGSSGEVLCLLSGGIDSPVAAWLTMKRGAAVSYVHFHPFEDNDEAINSKIGELIETLCPYSGRTRAFFVPSHPFSLAVMKIPARYDVVLFRRFMFRCAQRIAEEMGASAIATGESIAQVASQTLPNMAVIHRATELPVLMPLISHDKQEIVDLAKRIGTYDISLKSYKDCCSIIARHPETKAKLDVVMRLEAKAHLDKAVDESLSLMTTVSYG